MKRPDYRTLQALDAVIRERGFERAAQKLCITQSAVSQRIKQLENLFGQPLLVRTVPQRRQSGDLAAARPERCAGGLAGAP